MKKCAIALLTLSLATFAFAGPGQQDPTARLQAAGQVMNEIMAAPDKGIPEEVLNGAKCIAVVPSMAKGAFIVGGEHGRGVVSTFSVFTPQSGQPTRYNSTTTVVRNSKQGRSRTSRSYVS